MAQYAGITDGASASFTDAQKWACLIFGQYDINTVLAAVADADWQRIRISMKGTNLATRFQTLQDYLSRESATNNPHLAHLAQVRITNYVYALKRGGLIK